MIIILRTKYKCYNMVALSTCDYDYHFIVNVDGQWYNKMGGARLEYVDTSYVLSQKWPSSFSHNSETIFFAIKKDWYR